MVGKIRLGSEEIKYMTLFETLTGARVKDCVQIQNSMGFLINEGDMGLAIGKSGSNIEKVRKTIGKSIWVVEFSEDKIRFIKNLFQPIRVKQVRIHNFEDKRKAIVEVSKRDRQKAIGHDGVRIKIAKNLAKRQFGIEDINVAIAPR